MPDDMLDDFEDDGGNASGTWVLRRPVKVVKNLVVELSTSENEGQQPPLKKSKLTLKRGSQVVSVTVKSVNLYIMSVPLQQNRKLKACVIQGCKTVCLKMTQHLRAVHETLTEEEVKQYAKMVKVVPSKQSRKKAYPTLKGQSQLGQYAKGKVVEAPDPYR